MIDTRTAQTTIELDDIGDDSISIEAYTAINPITNDPYVTVIVFPAAKDLFITVDIGSIEDIEVEASHTPPRAAITFSGRVASAPHYIESMVWMGGYFFDRYGAAITPTFTVKHGKIYSSLECYGTAFITYVTKGKLYEYRALLTASEYTIGTIFAFDKDSPGISAQYTPLVMATEKKDPIDFVTVYSEKVLQEPSDGRPGEFEKPPNFPTDNIYPGAAGAGLSSKPIIGNSYFIEKRVHEYGTFYVEGTIDKHVVSVTYLHPYAGAASNPDIVYKLDSKVPEADPLDPTSVTNIQNMEAYITELRTKYAIQ